MPRGRPKGSKNKNPKKKTKTVAKKVVTQETSVPVTASDSLPSVI